jgi:hypothetical protein
MKQAPPSQMVPTAMAELTSGRHKRIGPTLLNLGTAGVFVAWLAVACYAIAYLVAH